MSLSSNRRGFFGLLAATPFAAKATVDDIGITKDPFPEMNIKRLKTYGGEASRESLSHEDRLDNVFNYVKKYGYPEWHKTECWRDAKNVDCLDPDIASYKSFSASGKIATQRLRNYERKLRSAINHHEEDKQYNTERSLFKKLTGVDWWPF